MIVRRLIVPGWLAGVLGATGALIAIGFVSIGFFVSLGGLVIAGFVALAVGVAAATIVDPEQVSTSSSIVALYLVVLAAAYFLILPKLVEPAPPGARGGPAVDMPSRGGAPAVSPPR